MIRKAYTVEFKSQVVKEILREGKSLLQIASEYGTHVNVISRWRDQALAGFPGLFDDRIAQDQAAKEAEWKKEKEGLYYEEVYLKHDESPRQARQELAAYLRFYNERRLHQALAYRTPAEFYFAKASKEHTP